MLTPHQARRRQNHSRGSPRKGLGLVSVDLARVGSLRRPRIRSSKSTQDNVLDLAWLNVDVLLPASEKQRREEGKILKLFKFFGT